jgi:hypothetical protein
MAVRDQLDRLRGIGPRWAWLLSVLPIVGIVGDIVIVVYAWRHRRRLRDQAGPSDQGDLVVDREPAVEGGR